MSVVQSGVGDSWTTLRVLDWTAQRFAREELDSSRLEAQILLAHVLECDRIALYTRFDQPLTGEELAGYREIIKRRLAGEPVAYLVGEQEFWSLPFKVDCNVLIPRRDSETVIELVLDEIADRGASVRIADVATGSGVLGITLAHELPAAMVVATDLSADALAVAAVNAERNGVAGRVELVQGDLLAPIAGRQPFDVVVSNLPYVASDDIAGLQREVRCEPRSALDGGPDGLMLIRRLLAGILGVLQPGALLVLEHGLDQDTAVRQLIADTPGLESAQTRKDLARQPRVTYTRRARGI